MKRHYYIKNKDICFTVKPNKNANDKVLNYQPLVQDVDVVFDLLRKYINKDIHIRTTRAFSLKIKEYEYVIRGLCRENNVGLIIHYEKDYAFARYTPYIPHASP